MAFLIYAWIASILYGLLVIISKLLSKHGIKNPWALTFIWSFMVLTFTAMTAVSHHVGLPKMWGSIFIISLCGTGVWIFYTLALYSLDASVISSLYNLRTAFSAILSAIVLSEILSLQQYLLILLIVIAGIFVTFDEEFRWRAVFKKGVFLLLLAILFSALSNVFVKIAIKENGYWETTLWPAIFTQIWLLGTIPFFKKDWRAIKLNAVGVVALLAGIEVIAVLATNKALATNVSLTTTITSLPLSVVMAILFSVFAPKLLEHHPTKVYLIRLTAAVIMIFAALQLSH